MLDKATPVDLGRYLGKWLELASFPTWFQRNCKFVTATYIQRKGYIEVKNSCTGNNGRKKIIGKAFTTSKSNLLKVVFFWPFKADYLIEFVDTDYQFAVVGNPSKTYLWILAREVPAGFDPSKPATAQGGIMKDLVAIAKRRGYDASRLVIHR